jgi:CheY-like chemotaxis protein
VRNRGGIRVLIIDDNSDSRALFAPILSQAGIDVTAVETVHEALLAARHARPDVVLCDLTMPGDDGFALIREVRSRRSDQGGAVPAAAVTEYARPEDRERALAACFQIHVAKPVEPSTLLEAVTRLVPRGDRTGASR